MDANAILRYVLDDIEEQADEVESAIDEGAFTVGEVIAEVVYVLHKIYKFEREDIRRALTDLLDEIDIADKPIVKDALLHYSETSLDYVDCVLIARARIMKDSILTFDKKLKKRLEKVA